MNLTHALCVNRRRGRTVAASRAEIPDRLAIADGYARVARAEWEGDHTASRTIAAGNAVLSAIAAADAICMSVLGVRSASTNHSDAVALVGQIDLQASKDLAILIGDKSQSHYGATEIDRGTLVRMMRSMERLLQTARSSSARAGLR